MNNIELWLIAERYWKEEILPKYSKSKGKNSSQRSVCKMVDSYPSLLIRYDILR
jgi:hypothetical protein